MAINISLQRVFPGIGVSTLQSIQQATGIAITSATTYYVPGTTLNSVAGLLVPTCTVGAIRVKIYNGAGTSPTVSKIQIMAYDGTNSVVVADWNFSTAVTLSTTSWCDVTMAPLIADTATGSTSGGAVGQLISGSSATSGNGGIQCFKVIPTLGGTSPAATMDVEVFGLI